MWVFLLPYPYDVQLQIKRTLGYYLGIYKKKMYRLKSSFGTALFKGHPNRMWKLKLWANPCHKLSHYCIKELDGVELWHGLVVNVVWPLKRSLLGKLYKYYFKYNQDWNIYPELGSTEITIFDLVDSLIEQGYSF